MITKILRLTFLLKFLFLSFLITSCAGIGVSKSDDPYINLGNSIQLYQKLNRPIPAETLINASITTFKNNKDKSGLAQAYAEYASFLQSQAVINSKSFYTKSTFLDRQVTYKNRYIKSIEYLEKSRILYKELNKIDSLTNIHWRIGMAYYEYTRNKDSTCANFNSSLSFHQKSMALFPNEKRITLTGFKNHTHLITSLKDQAGCDLKNSEYLLSGDINGIISNATTLFLHKNRPIPAEILLNEAIRIAIKKNNQLELAKAYRYYGFLVQSDSINLFSDFYIKNKFLNKNINMNNRFEKGLEYFNKSGTIYSNMNAYALLEDNHLLIGAAYAQINKPDLACKNLDIALGYYKQAKPSELDKTQSMRKEFKDNKAYYTHLRKEFNCK